MFALTTATASAEVVKIKGLDAENVCAVLKSVYALQGGALAAYPLARVVQLKNDQPGVHEYSIGASEEKLICIESIYHRPGSSTLANEVKVVYNGETSDFAKKRTVSEWTLFKAYEIYGNLAQAVCSQFEEFNAVEEQAQLPAGNQVFGTYTKPTENIFGVLASVVTDKTITCGQRDGEKVLQIHSQDVF